jgi:malate dehydrogenase (quinone)
MPTTPDNPDVVLIGAGIMSATLGTFLKELEPSLTVAMFETLDDCAQESSEGWNNAGTGHAANCELNYTPQRKDGSVDISKALEVSAHHCYRGMEYSEDRAKIAEWAPLIMDGRGDEEPFAATRMITGTDVDYGALTHLLVKHLSDQSGFYLHYNREVVGLEREDNGRWRVSVEDVNDGGLVTVSAKFVFIGAGGGSLRLLQRSKIGEGKGFGGFPVSGIWLRCDVDAISHRHHAKVYGKAASGSPPMSVPHLDTRIIGGTHSLLFGPYAGFSTRFLKRGELTDLFTSLTFDNILPLLDVARDNIDLSEYLIGQVLQSSSHQFAALKQFFPRAMKKDWKEAVAGVRVQTIKPRESKGWLNHEVGDLEFGTELVAAEDKSIVALLGASPGASTAASIAIDVLKKCFGNRLTEDSWLPRLKAIIPTYGIDLKTDADACRHTRAETAPVLKIDNV